jgi:putative FmdB family regulatory protein
MPLYTYQCPRAECQAECSELRKMAEKDEPMICYRCGKAQMNLILGPTAGVVKNPAVPRGSK